MNKGIFQKMVGERIFECRKQKGSKGMTQDEFAKALGKSLRTIQKYESGDIDISLSTLYDISEILGVSVSTLVNCQQSHTKIDSLADVMAFLIELSKKEELHFDIVFNKNGREQTAALSFGEMNVEADYNRFLCHFLETFKSNREALETYYIDRETFNAWAEKVMAENQLAFLSNKEYDNLSGEELAKKRQELFDKKLEEAVSKKTKRQDNKK